MSQATVQEEKLSVEQLQKLNLTQGEVDGIRKIRQVLIPRIQKAKSTSPKGKRTEDYARLARIVTSVDGAKQEQNKKTPEEQAKAKVDNITALRKAMSKVNESQNLEFKSVDRLLRACSTVYLDLPTPPKPERKAKTTPSK